MTRVERVPSPRARLRLTPRNRQLAFGGIAIITGLLMLTAAMRWYGVPLPDSDHGPNHEPSSLGVADGAQQDPPSVVAGTVHMDKDQQQAIGLKTIKVTEGSQHSVVIAPGRVAPDETQYAFITPRASGVVRSVAARLGQEVKAGDLLATIDSPIVGDARLELYIRLQSMELARTQADWQETIYHNTLDLIDRLKRGETPQQIHGAFTSKALGENREKMMTAYAQFRLAEVTLQRNRELYAQKLITPKHFQQVNADFEVAQATYQSLMDQMGFDARLANIRAQQARRQAETSARAAQERLRILGVKPDGTEPEVKGNKVLGVKPDGTIPALSDGDKAVAAGPESVLPLEKDRGKAAVEPVGVTTDPAKSLADAPVSSYSIWAPFDGTILDREMIVPGVAVDSTHRIFTLANLSTVYVEANIHEHDFTVISHSRGAPIRFSSPAYPQRAFEGDVIYTGDLVEETSRTVKLIALARNPDRLLKPGMFVNVEIVNLQSSVGIEIPSSAVLTQGSRTFVYVQSGPETFVQRDVIVQPMKNRRVLIQRGLEPSQVVVVEGAFKLKAMDSALAGIES